MERTFPPGRVTGLRPVASMMWIITLPVKPSLLDISDVATALGLKRPVFKVLSQNFYAVPDTVEEQATRSSLYQPSPR